MQNAEHGIQNAEGTVLSPCVFHFFLLHSLFCILNSDGAGHIVRGDNEES